MIVKDIPLEVSIPEMVRVRQELNQPAVTDIRKTLHESLERIHFREKIKPGKRIAITAGSRGIANIVDVIRFTAEEVRAAGGDPFVLSAMGSHGGGTPEGQREMLAEYGITEKSVNAPLICSIDVIEFGKTEQGITIYFDRIALESDGIIAVNRIKPHTDFRAPTESGLLKILAIGLGRVKGATQLHQLGVYGMREVVPSAGRIILKKAPIICGVGIVENAKHQVAILEAIDHPNIERREHELLLEAWKYYPRIPFPKFDLLVLDEMGKDVSGAGIDPNVIGRMMIQGEEELPSPRINRIAVLDLTPGSHGNAVGIGLADVITKRLFEKIRFKDFHLNMITATIIDRSKIPIVAEHDKDAIRLGLRTCWVLDPHQAKVVHMKNTLNVEEFSISKPLADLNGASLTKIGNPYSLSFDKNGSLIHDMKQ